MSRLSKFSRSIKGKIVLVTGAASGMGRATAELFSDEGAVVIVSDLNQHSVNNVVEKIKKNGSDAEGFVLDISDKKNIQDVVKKITDKYGLIDILINNAGVAWGEPIDTYPEMGWDKVMDTNVKGIFFLTQKLLPLLREAGKTDPSRVINIGSIDGLKKGAFENFAYGPSKAAVHHLSRVLAAFLIKEKIIVNAIAPGPYPTWMLSTGVGFGGDTDVDWSQVGDANPSGRVGGIEDIAGLAIFLCSRAGEYIVGQTIASDGGAVADSN